MEMLKRYNAGSIDLTDDEAELLAMQTKRMGVTKDEFDVESKPLRKGAFDLADMAAFGMLPNEWRPRSPGQDLYGETGLDKFAGGVGSTAGLFTGATGAVKGTKIGWEAIKKMFAKKRADDIARSFYKGQPQLTAGTRPLQLGPGSPRINPPSMQLGPHRTPGPGMGRMIDNMKQNKYVQEGGYIGMQFGGGVGFVAPDVDEVEIAIPPTSNFGSGFSGGFGFMSSLMSAKDKKEQKDKLTEQEDKKIGGQEGGFIGSERRNQQRQQEYNKGSRLGYGYRQ